MSDFQGWDVALLKSMGFPVTQNNLAFVRAWHVAEGGTASNNPLNTTQPYQGATNYNSVGVKNFPTSQAGLQATMTTLRNGHYPAILQALKSGNPQWSEVLSKQLNTWGTGSAWMKGYRSTPTGGYDAAASDQQAAPAAPGLDPMKTQLASMLINSSQNHGQIDIGSLLGLAIARKQSGMGAGIGASTGGSQSAGGASSGDGMGGNYKMPLTGLVSPIDGHIIGGPFQGSHTLFHNWESDNAIDVAAPVGTPIRATADGVIGSEFGPLNAKDPRLAGLRLHLQTGNNEFYYAHRSKFAPGIQPGSRVRRGQIIGYSGSANGTAHLHLGVKYGNPQSIYGN